MNDIYIGFIIQAMLARLVKQHYFLARLVKFPIKFTTPYRYLVALLYTGNQTYYGLSKRALFGPLRWRRPFSGTLPRQNQAGRRTAFTAIPYDHAGGEGAVSRTHSQLIRIILWALLNYRCFSTF